MDPRLDRAHGALAGLIFGWELGGEASSENGAATASVGEAVLALLASHEPVGLPTFPSQLSHLQDFYALLISNLLLGISTSTSGQQAFANAMWNNCEDEEPNCREFQAATLVAAAVSLASTARTSVYQMFWYKPSMSLRLWMHAAHGARNQTSWPQLVER